MTSSPAPVLSRLRGPLIIAGLLAFMLLATLNSAGYRYGASDQAFYAVAAIGELQPDLFPRDRTLIDAQARLTSFDETIAALTRLTGAPLPVLFAALQVATLTLFALAAFHIGRTYYRTEWGPMALVAALSIRHGIAKTGTNSLEGYFHPRQLAFALGLWGLLLFLRGRTPLAALLVVAGGLVHPTTAAWFAVWLTVSFFFLSMHRLRPAATATGVGVLAAVGVWAFTAGPLEGRLATMDAEWVATLATKDYLFPLDWPLTAWLVNLSYPVVIAWLFETRRRAGLVTPRETAIVVGASALLGLFLLSLPFNAARVQLALQLQPGRIFWMLDFLATIYVVWGLVEGRRIRARRATIAIAAICAVTLIRGAYIKLIEFPDRPAVSLDLPASDWTKVMAWVRSSPRDSHWLADPGHASRYGSSLRLAGERDVLVEASKDQAIGMYSRAVAMRTRDRIAAVGDFPALTTERASALASAYDLDFLVTEQTLPLPIAFSAGQLRIYRLR